MNEPTRADLKRDLKRMGLYLCDDCERYLDTPTRECPACHDELCPRCWGSSKAKSCEGCREWAKNWE